MAMIRFSFFFRYLIAAAAERQTPSFHYALRSAITVARHAAAAIFIAD
jgi:hypothetical protein